MNKLCSSSIKVSTHKILWLYCLWFWRRRFLKFAPFLPFGAPPLGPPGVHLPHMNNFGSLPPKDDPHQVWLKSANRFWRRRWKCKKLTDDGRKRMAIAHWSLRLRWAKKVDNKLLTDRWTDRRTNMTGCLSEFFRRPKNHKKLSWLCKKTKVHVT